MTSSAVALKGKTSKPRRDKRARPAVQSQNIDYALHTLGWASFQDLCISVFEEVFDRPVNFYSKTNDRGRDGTFKGLIHEKISNDKRSSTLQTKHFSQSGASLTLSSLNGEREKVRKLASDGLAHSYVIMTNGIVSAAEAAKIEATFLSDGALEVCIFGRDWINRKIHEHPKIRATVPRIYGLGDLSWIIDERAIAQALEVLGSLGNDMRCYVRTKAHLKAVDALLKHGFVLLIGEPAAGKSTIAANLAMAAIDISGCDVIRVTGPNDIVTHWNPKEKDRFFWVDDAFGSTQYNRDTADLWNKVLPTMAAALKCGNRFVLTSRDYIWRQARQNLKSESFKPLLEGRVVIYTEDLSKAERERILYNHIKFGDQPISRRRWMKPNLESIAALDNFKPEIARRLGSTFFTRDLDWTPEGLQKFVDAPRRFLADVIRQLPSAEQAAVALIFLNGGRVESPISEDESVQVVEKTLGVTCAAIKPAMEHLHNTLFLHVTESGQTYWTYKHPTISDAYATLISERPELIEIYLRGAKLPSLLHEVVYGTKKVIGSTLRVPKTLYDILAFRLKDASPQAARSFLITRTDAEFRKRFLQENPKFLRGNLGFSNPLIKDIQSQFFITIGREGLLNEQNRNDLLDCFASEIANYGDVTFLLDDDFISFIGPDSYAQLIEIARTDLAPNFEDLISGMADGCDEDNADDYFDDSSEALNALQVLFPEDEKVHSYVSTALALIEETVTEAKDNAEETGQNSWDDEGEQFAGTSYQTGSQRDSPFSESNRLATPSVFDDIDD